MTKQLFSSIAMIALFTATVVAQDVGQSPAAPTSATVQTTIPILSDCVAQVLKLHQAKISESTLLTFIQNSPAVYTLDADQIIYLKHQGVSESVITTMLSHKSVPAKMITASPATAVVAPTVTYIQPATTYYSPAYNDYYPGYYPYYAWPYPAVSLSFGFGGGYHGGFRGGGGWHHR